jgi:hypothetical protein
MDSFDDVIRTIQKMKLQYDDMFTENIRLKAELESYKNVMHDNNMLMMKNNELQDAMKTFSNVSLIVNAKNEVYNLKNELSLLNKKLEYYKSQETYKYKQTHTIEHIDDDNNTQTSDEEDTESVDECEVIEKNIHGKLYFVSDDDERIIYERIYLDGEWEIGDDIGRYTISSSSGRDGEEEEEQSIIWFKS